MSDALKFQEAANRIVVRYADGSINTLDDLEKEITAALRVTYSIAAEREREACIKVAEMYVLGDDVNLLDPMEVRQDQIASNIVKAIRASGEREDQAQAARGAPRLPGM